ncbi:MAG: Ig-like domain-containing protein [Xanthomonadales bacterium]|nr:Lysophospholipase VolA [Xanthomonadales bacterium]MCC6593838.1 Ig-like domain-containing protein [Xanthomonadales bacterium]MCE7929953.1 lipase [Xanthomonadales bacterium PRO6]
MHLQRLVPLAIAGLLLGACSGGSNSPRATAQPPATNGNGGFVSGIMTARFDPTNAVIPFPNNLLLQGSRDLTVNAPAANPNNFGDPTVALNALDGFSTSAPFVMSFSAAIAPTTLVGGQTVRVFEVQIVTSGAGAGAVQSVVRELASPAEFVPAVATSDASGRTLAIVPTRPLEELKSYMTVITSGVTDTAGNNATPDQTYFLAKRTSPLASGSGAACVSLDPLLPASSACALEPLRQLTNTMEAAAVTRGVVRNDIVLAWVANTQGVSPALRAVRTLTRPQATRFAPTGLTTAAAGLPPVADIYIGTINLPYYLQAPGVGTPANPPTAVLTGFWRAGAGAYVAPFNQLGLDPTSTNVTVANPIPVATTTVVAPVLVTLPNAASGRTRPASGWPVVMFQHGVTRNRCDMLAISATMAAAGFAVVSIDQPLHGASPTRASDPCRPFHIGSTPFAALGARERTFDVDLINNATGAAGPDGVVDDAGTHSINLSSLLTSRDNLRQAVADLFVVAASIPSMDVNNNQVPDFDGSRIVFAGQSLGGIVGTVFMALEPTVNTGLLSVPGGQIAFFLNASPSFGPRIRAGIAAARGILQTDPAFPQLLGQFLQVTQTVLDSGDPINYARYAASERILLHEVVGGGSVLPDQVIPNAVSGAPLAGTEPLIAALGLSTITQSTINQNGIRGAVRFIQGDHGALLSPAASAAATVEMQTQMASMLASGGIQVQVTNTGVIRTQ